MTDPYNAWLLGESDEFPMGGEMEVEPPIGYDKDTLQDAIDNIDRVIEQLREQQDYDAGRAVYDLMVARHQLEAVKNIL